MGTLLEERSDGRICIEVFPSAQLGEEADTIEQTQLGVIDMNRVSLGPFNNIIEETKVFSLPYIFRSVEHMHTVVRWRDRAGRSSTPSATTIWSGLPTTTAARGPSTTASGPSRRSEDMAGMSFRVMQSDVFVDMVSALGANATPLPLWRGLYLDPDRGDRQGPRTTFRPSKAPAISRSRVISRSTST